MPNKVLVVSAGLIHPTIRSRSYLKQLLLDSHSYSFQFTTKTESLELLAQRTYKAVVLYLHQRTVSEKIIGILEDFVFNGGGLLALHSAAMSFRDHKKYVNLLGGKVLEQGDIVGFQVIPENNNFMIFKGIPTFGIFDEYNRHTFKEDVVVQFSAKSKNKKEPVVWTRELGKGRISYCSLGHCSPVLQNYNVQQIVMNCLHWVCGKNDPVIRL